MKTLLSSIKITLSFCVILFVGYVLVLLCFAKVVAPNSGEAEVITVNDKIVGAANVGQLFSDSIYFWGRPSAVDYNGEGSGGSNKGPSNVDYLEQVKSRIELFLLSHPYLQRSELPSELVTASASGLDPHISPQSAAVQIGRVAKARSMSEEDVAQIVAQKTVCPMVGEPYINVLELNVAIDSETDN